MKKVYVSLNKKAREAKQIYVGVGNKAKKVKKLYVGDKGKAKLAFESSITIDDLEYMQDFAKFTSIEKKTIRDSMEVEKRYTLTDIRDNNQYQIARLKDDNIWMVDDLKFGGDEETVLTPDTSDVADEWTLPASNIEAFESNNSEEDSTPRFYANKEEGNYFYNWNAVTAGVNVGRTTYGAQMFSSVLPCGWKLPMYSGIRELPSLLTKYGFIQSGNAFKGDATKLLEAANMKTSTAYIVSKSENTLQDCYRRWCGTNATNLSGQPTDKSFGVVLSVSFSGEDYANVEGSFSRFGADNTYGFQVRGVVRIDEDYAGQRDKRNWKISDIKYMQDFARLTAAEKQAVRDSMTLEQTYTLLDKRDNKPYEVARLKDDNIWMVQNLALGSNDRETIIEQKDSDFDSVETFTLPQGSNKGPGFKVNVRDPNDMYLDDIYGGYYTTYLTTCYQRTWDVHSETTESILPRAWRLPRSEETEALSTAYGDNLIETAPGFQPGGYYYNQNNSSDVRRTGNGIYGVYPTSTWEKSSDFYALYARKTGSKNQSTGIGYGLNVRGIVRIDEDYTGRLLSGESA